VDNDELMTIGRFGRPERAGRARQIAMLRWDGLPIEDIRRVIDDPARAATHDVLTRHRRRLERQRDLLTAQIRDADRFLEKGITMPPLPTGSRPSQIKVAVDDVDAAVAFYVTAFGFNYDIVRRTEQSDYSAFMFGAYGQDNFFLMHLIAGQDRMDLPGPSTFGLLVEDLDTSHARAIDAGAAETVAPHAPEGMPRRSAVRDPSGNWIWLYQA
jgi:predicted enzyme related to lactoylglutathione lyase